MSDTDRAREFERLFAMYEDRLRALTMSMVRSRTEAEDVLQQASLTLWQKLDQFRAGTDFMAWAGRVIYFEALQHRRKHARDRLELGDAFVEAVAREASNEALWVALGEREQALEACIEQLQPEHREILRKRYVDECEVGQMSALFNRSVEAIYLVLSRLRRSVQECVARRVQAGNANHG